ncbi:phosphotransferase [Geodermatophilus sp. TF02-6]|uniref:phosphotransferase n=1 Tax=Geodermatophilus sp. TF02-6 TaxID=2250575 RepID=UPI0018F2E686|nr:phosphotransferase [Geodermatophilus sp. TF02-6]
MPLPGGIANRGAVVRVGDTVRRPRRRTSPATHALLRHLADVGFAGAPRFLGVDAQGREVLSFIPGSTVLPPYPEWALHDEALLSVARLLREYHRAVEGFDPAPHEWPTSPPGSFAGELVSHNDPNLDNVVFRGGRAVALIDFDLAAPGSRLWDVACAARLWAPLRPEASVHDARRGRGFDRLRLFCDGYGLAEADRARVVAAVRENQAWFCRLVDRYAAAGHAAFAEYAHSDLRMPAQAYRLWLADSEPAIRQAMGMRG